MSRSKAALESYSPGPGVTCMGAKDGADALALPNTMVRGCGVVNVSLTMRSGASAPAGRSDNGGRAENPNEAVGHSPIVEGTLYTGPGVRCRTAASTGRLGAIANLPHLALSIVPGSVYLGPGVMDPRLRFSMRDEYPKRAPTVEANRAALGA